MADDWRWHKAEAERLVDLAGDTYPREPGTTFYLAAAQVHATLATIRDDDGAVEREREYIEQVAKAERVTLVTFPPPDELVETVARLLYDRQRRARLGEPEWDDAGEFLQNHYRDIARAVLAAIGGE